MNNANLSLKQTGKEGRFYKYDKYVRTAYVTAYIRVLKAIDGYLISIVIKARYQKMERKLTSEIDYAHQILHFRDIIMIMRI